jgi:branched-subunit amino acid aminotransferase/4-amino-4-deoxychorismate lyase
VIDVASKHFLPLLEGIYEIGDLTDADEIFLTSSALGVAPVTTFDFRRYALEPSSVTGVILQAFAALTRGEPRG